MKNKPLTYLLITAVAAVWGIIFYRIFSAPVNEETEFKSFVQSRLINESLDDYKLKDTFTLALNYRDPFLNNSSVSVEAAAPAVQDPVTVSAFNNPKPVKPQVNWEGIRYTGYILNASGKRAVAIIIINGKEYMLSEGQGAGGLKLLKNLKDSVKVSYQDKIKHLRIQ